MSKKIEDYYQIDRGGKLVKVVHFQDKLLFFLENFL